MRRGSGPYGRIATLFSAALVSAIFGSGCVSSTGGVSFLDDFYTSPESQRLMNEAVDKFVDQMNLQTIGSSSVQIVTRGMGSTPKDIKVADHPFGMMSSGTEMMEKMQTSFGGVTFSSYLKAQMERKIASSGGKITEENPDAQIVVNTDAVGLKRRIFSLPPLPIFFVDIVQDREYWAIIDGTIDLKSGDGSKIFQTQKISAESGHIHSPVFFRQSPMF